MNSNKRSTKKRPAPQKTLVLPTEWPTMQDIDSKRIRPGKWRRADLEAWGVSWPPKRGWRLALIRQDVEWFLTSQMDVIGAKFFDKRHMPK